MANQVTRQNLVKWLLKNGFEERSGRASGNRKFSRPKADGSGSITVPGYGPNDLTKKHVALILRALEGMGFDKAQVLAEITTGKKPRNKA